MSLILILAAMSAIWLIPAVKAVGGIAVWHILVVASLTCVSIVPRWRRELRATLIANRFFILLISLFPLFVFFRDAYGGEWELTLSDYLLRGFGGLLFAILLSTCIRSVSYRSKGLWMLFAIAFAQASLAILQFYDPGTFYGVPDLLAFGSDLEYSSSAYIGRVRGFCINIHIYGQCMLGLVSFFLPLLFQPAVGARALFFPLWPGRFIVGYSMIPLMMTYMRAAYFSVFIEIAVMLVHSIAKGKYVLKGILGISLAIMVVIASLNYFGVLEGREAWRITNPFYGDTDTIRIESFKVALEAFYTEPVFGVGGRKVEFVIAIHNIFFRVLAYYGMVGILLYLGFYAAILSRIWRISSDCSQYRTGLLLWLGSYLLFNMTHTSGFWIGGLQEWTFVGILIGLPQATKTGRVLI